MTKVCSKCRVEKELNTDNFAKRKSSKDGFDSHCKECKKKYDKERYPLIQADMSEYKKGYYQENSDKLKEYSREYYKNNQDKCKNDYKKWSINNPHIRRTINERRRTRERNLPSTLKATEWIKIKSYFNNACAYCGISEKDHFKKNNERLHQEHFIPLSKGGTHDKNNIIPSCRSCNSSKANNDFSEWYPKQEYYSEERENKILKCIL